MTYLELLEASLKADTIALAFETNGLDMDDWQGLHKDLCGIEVDFIHCPKPVTGGERESRVRALAVIIQASRRVERVLDREICGC